jgi:hypothetical protein
MITFPFALPDPTPSVGKDLPTTARTALKKSVDFVRHKIAVWIQIHYLPISPSNATWGISSLS